MNEITTDNQQKVLIIDPDEFYLMLHRKVLLRHGYEVFIASNVELGFLILQYFAPDIIVSAEDRYGHRRAWDWLDGWGWGCVKERGSNKLFYQHCRDQKIPFIIMYSEDIDEDGFFR